MLCHGFWDGVSRLSALLVVSKNRGPDPNFSSERGRYPPPALADQQAQHQLPPILKHPSSLAHNVRVIRQMASPQSRQQTKSQVEATHDPRSQ
jgi:hypothetical protein